MKEAGVETDRDEGGTRDMREALNWARWAPREREEEEEEEEGRVVRDGLL